MTGTGMTCKELVDFLMAYDDRELADDVRSEFEQHLVDCPPCHDYLDTYRETVRLGRAACADDEAPTEAPEELIQAVLAARSRG